MARTMLQEAETSLVFWGEAMATAVFILNRWLTRALERQTPMGPLTESRPRVEFFRVFGCLSYRLVDLQHRTKFETKSKLCVLIGYCTRSRVNLAIDLHIKHVHVIRNVRCFEDNFFDWSKASSSAASVFMAAADVESDEISEFSPLDQMNELSEILQPQNTSSPRIST